MKSLNSLLVLSVLSFSLVSCNKFAGKDDSNFFGVEKSSIVFDGEEPVGEEPQEVDGGAEGGADVGSAEAGADAGSEGGAAAAGGASGGIVPPTDGEQKTTTSSGSAAGGYVPPVDGPNTTGSAAGGSSSGSYSSASASGGASGGSSYVAPKCEDAKDAQQCADLNCEAVMEDGEDPKYLSCVPSTPKTPVQPVSSGCGCGGDVKKVLVCHQQGNGGFHTINISCNALKAHLDHHNDACGACQVGQ